MVDKFGNESHGLVYETRLDDDVGDKINWENAVALDLSRLWKVILLNQSFR
jgi:hypothetical protein